LTSSGFRSKPPDARAPRSGLPHQFDLAVRAALEEGGYERVPAREEALRYALGDDLVIHAARTLLHVRDRHGYGLLGRGSQVRPQLPQLVPIEELRIERAATFRLAASEFRMVVGVPERTKAQGCRTFEEADRLRTGIHEDLEERGVGFAERQAAQVGQRILARVRAAHLTHVIVVRDPCDAARERGRAAEGSRSFENGDLSPRFARAQGRGQRGGARSDDRDVYQQIPIVRRVVHG
jgi:hypothetical protein